jgi:hypothetical protein
MLFVANNRWPFFVRYKENPTLHCEVFRLNDGRIFKRKRVNKAGRISVEHQAHAGHNHHGNDRLAVMTTPLARVAVLESLGMRMGAKQQ